MFVPMLQYFLGLLVVVAGIALMLWTTIWFRRGSASISPHGQPSALITDGPFRLSRNPIYLGDVLLLTGVILRLDAVVSLVLVPVFVWLLERRFILPEEDRLRRKFRADFARYERKTRRWV